MGVGRKEQVDALIKQGEAIMMEMEAIMKESEANDADIERAKLSASKLSFAELNALVRTAEDIIARLREGEARLMDIKRRITAVMAELE
jgi:hypothetical protein